MLNNINVSLQKYGQFLKFCIVGVTNTTISLVVYYLLLKLGIHYLLASTIAYCAGLLNGYILSSAFVFKQKRNVNQALKFIGVYLSSLLINLLLLYCLVDIFDISEFFAQVVVTFFNVFYNYFLNKIWTFNN
ncbi:GtrA family protein [Neobacillus vireti]|uniref:GtrA family protein n=1 Tax=Neobacillus vireti TaxID=220686 RepID=UPI002FFF64D4